MGSWVSICPGCRGRFRDDENFFWHIQVCAAYAALPTDTTPDSPTTSEHSTIPEGTLSS